MKPVTRSEPLDTIDERWAAWEAGVRAQDRRSTRRLIAALALTALGLASSVAWALISSR